MADEKSQQEFVTKFRAMPKDRQTALIGKMTPEQKSTLAAAIKANPAQTPGQTSAPGAKGSGAVGALGDVAVGFGKAAMETVNTVSKGLNKIPGVGETLAPKQGIQAVDKMTESTGTAQTIGKAGENVAEYAAGEGALKALTTALKAKNIPMVANLVRQYPWLSKVAVSGMKNFVLGTAQSAAHGEEHPLREGAITAATGVAGEAAAGAIEKRGVRAVPKAYEAVNEHIGLKQSDLPKWERMSATDAQSVGKTVMEQGALRNTLEDTHHAIEMKRDTVQNQTEALINNAKGRGVPMHADLSNINQQVAKHFLDMGRDINGVTTNAANSIYNEFKGITSPQMSVKDAFALRKKIGAQIDWNNLKGTENVKQMFLGELYHTLNADIQRALPPAQATQFEKLNRIQNRLIIAREASGSKIVREGMKEAKESGLASGAATFAKRAAVGTVAGAVTGAAVGHTKEGVEGGAAFGAASGLMSAVKIPRMDVRAEKIIAKAAPRLAEAARKSPTLARAIESATAAHGGGSGSVNQQ